MQQQDVGTRACVTGAHIVTLRNFSTWLASGAAPEATRWTLPPSRALTFENARASTMGTLAIPNLRYASLILKHAEKIARFRKDDVLTFYRHPCLGRILHQPLHFHYLPGSQL